MSTVDFKFDLGVKVRDQVTGFTGTVTGRLEYLNGCKQYGVRPLAEETKGKYPEAVYLDEGQLELVSEGVKIKKKDLGGPETRESELGNR